MKQNHSEELENNNMDYKYKVYGLGNSLLDYEYLVRDSMLNDLEIKKGTMMLNEFDKHQEIHAFIRENAEIQKIIPGGSVANSIYSMSQFDSDVCFTEKVSNDETGKVFIESLNNSNVITNISQINSSSSGECLVLITPDNERTMNTYLGSSSLLCEEDISKDLISNSKYLLIEGYLVSGKSTLNSCHHAIKLANEANRKIVITLSDPNIVNFFYHEMIDIIKKNMDIIFCNEQEALNISKSGDINEAIEFLKKYTNKLIITLGENGVVYIDNNEVIKIDGYDVPSRDFTGAGDMFLGAFMHQYDNNKDNIKESLSFANMCASEIIQVYGAKFEDVSKYKTLIEKFNN